MPPGGRLTRALALVGVLLVVYNFAYNIPINRPVRVLKPVTVVRPPVFEDLPHEVPPQHENPPQVDPPQVDPPQEEPPQEDPPQEDPPPATGSIAVTPRRTHRADVGACAPSQVLSRSVQQDHGLDVPHRPLNWVVPPSSQWPEASCSPSALCVELGRAAGADRQVLLVVADAGSGAQLDSLVASAKAAGVVGQLLVAALDDAAGAKAKQLGCGGVWRVPDATLAAAPTPRARKYLAAAAVVAAGVSVVYADLRVSLSADPFGYIFGDADVEAASSGRGIDRGHMRVAMDPCSSMSRAPSWRCHSSLALGQLGLALQASGCATHSEGAAEPLRAPNGRLRCGLEARPKSPTALRSIPRSMDLTPTFTLTLTLTTDPLQANGMVADV